MGRKKWCVASLDKEKALAIAEKFNIDSFAALLLVSRGIVTDKQIEQFLSDSVILSDPFEIKDMDKAVRQISESLEGNEKIAIYGDYDADGVTAASLLFLYLEMLGADVVCYIPDRNSEGYGLNTDAIKALCDDGVNLIITVDNGISALSEAEYIYELGMKLVVTDHHKVGAVLPRAEAVVDPHRPDCRSSFKDWAGVGVAFKLICALSGGDDENILDSFSDLVSIGTIADIVSLTGENRTIVRHGIKKINSDTSCGISALKKAAGVGEKELTATSVAFSVVPRINAIGRISRADRAFELLISDNDDIAFEIAQEINESNVSRQSLEQQITLEAEKLLLKYPEMAFDRVLVFDGEGWHGGVIGIVAARFVERFGKPCIVITSDGEESKGSGRSLEGFSLYDAINCASDLLTHFGGHTLAAGFGIKTKDIPEFRRRVNNYAKTVDMPFPRVNLDCKLRPDYISADLLPVISMLEPFGAGNAQPLFGLFDMKLIGVQSIGNGKHVRLNLSKGDTTVQALKFGVSAEAFPYKKGDRLDLAVQLERNEYMGTVRISIYVKDIRMSLTNDETFLNSVRLYEKVRRKERLNREEALLCLPDRKFVAEVYRYIRDNGFFESNTDVLCYRLSDDGSKACRVLLSIDILKELGVFTVGENKNIIVNSDIKADLESSALMNYLKSLCG